MTQSYPRTYAAILEMVRGALLHTSTARAIARRGVNFIGSLSPLLPRMWGQWSLTSEDGVGGYPFDYPAEEEFSFPLGGVAGTPSNANRYGDPRSVGEGRLVVNVTEAGVAGSSLTVSIAGGSFAGAAPSCPLDATGMHVSGWEPMTLSPPPDLGALIGWVVLNPSSSPGSGAVGVCQFQVR